MLVFLFLSLLSGINASGGIYNSTCTSNTDCWSGLTCQSGYCLTSAGMFNAPCTTYTCYGNASNTACLPSTAECKGNYYCQYQGSSLLCLQGYGPTQPLLGGTWGFPCSTNASCYTGYYCESNPSTYGTYGQPVCMLNNKLTPGYCTVHSDCQSAQNNVSTYKCGTLSGCNRGSCDVVQRQCDTASSPYNSSFWHNTNCYPLYFQTLFGTMCTATCPCGV